MPKSKAEAWSYPICWKKSHLMNNPSFDQAESDIHPAAWFRHIYHFPLFIYLSLFFIAFVSHSSFICFRFYNRFQTISTNRSHLWLIRFEPPTTIWATQLPACNIWYQSLSSWLRWYLSLHLILACICFSIHKPKIHKNCFFLFQVLFLHIFVLSVHHTLKPRKRKEKVLFDWFKNRKSQKKVFAFISFHKRKSHKNLCFEFDSFSFAFINSKAKRNHPSYCFLPFLLVHFVIASEKKKENIFKL